MTRHAGRGRGRGRGAAWLWLALAPCSGIARAAPPEPAAAAAPAPDSAAPADGSLEVVTTAASIVLRAVALEPAGSTVELGQPPIAATLAAGRYRIEAAGPGYRPWSREVEIVAGERVELQVDPELISGARLELRPTNEDSEAALVQLDGVELCALPCREEIEPGRHQLEIRKRKRKGLSFAVDVVQADEVVIDVSLAPSVSRAPAIALAFPGQGDAELRVALTVAPASAGGRGRVLLGDEQRGLGWLRVASGGEVELREASAYAQVHAADPEAFADDPSQGWGLTWCPDLQASAVVGGRLGPGQAAVALALEGDELRMIGVGDPPQQATIGAPIYACELGLLRLPGAATSLAVVDLDLDGDDDDDLLVGAPALGQVWIYENLGDGLADAPTQILSPDLDAVEFGASIAHVELGGEAPAVIVVGDPGAAVGGEGEVGRVFVFDASTGALLQTIEERHG